MATPEPEPTPSCSESESDAVTVAACNAIDAIALEAIVDGPGVRKNRQSRSHGDISTKQHHTVDREQGRDFQSEAASAALAASDEMVGRRIGPYQLVARIGSGFRSVYRAVHMVETAQQVALTLMKLETDSDVVLRQFHTQIHVQTALGRHLNITPLLDAGTTEDGLLYVVAEYVNGQCIDEYCNSRQLNILARVRLFAQVCEAVHFAHQHAVIHHNLKPSNVLVIQDGTPTVIGFGITELIGSGTGGDRGPTDDFANTPATPSPTGEPVLTPEFGSPEQVGGEVVTTASDVYALGVMLYQLLCGCLPYRLKTWSTPEICQAIYEQVPEKPSAVVSRWPIEISDSAHSEIGGSCGLLPQQLKRILTGDLDSITLMALRKDPLRRYASAQQFADDLHRYLAGMPTRAHQGSLAYRINKFTRRNRAAVLVGIFLVAALIASITGTTIGLVRVRRDRDRANRAFHEARQTINQFFTRLTEERLLQQPGLLPLRNELLRDARRFYGDLLDQRGALLVRSADSALTRVQLAKIIELTGSRTDAIAHYQQAIASWEELAAVQPGNEDYQARLAQTLTDLGTLLLRSAGRLSDALHSFERARKLVERLIQLDPHSVRERRRLGQILISIAEVQKRLGKADQATSLLEQVLAIESALASEDPQSLDPLIALAKANSELGRILSEQPAESFPAMAAYQRAVEIREAVVRSHSELPEQAHQFALDLRDLSTLQGKAGESESALQNLARALEILNRIDQLYPGIATYKAALGASCNMMSNLERQRGEYTEALGVAQKAHTVFEQLVGEYPQVTSYRRGLAQSYCNLGRLFARTGQLEEALRSFQRAIDFYESLSEIDLQDSYNLACSLALSIPLMGAKRERRSKDSTSQGKDAPPDLSMGGKLRRQRSGDRAMEVLRAAARSGFLSSEMLQTDTDLDPLRPRMDFQSLVKELEEKPLGVEK